MNEISNEMQPAELLQQLGLKEYEAKCFVALSRVDSGTAKEISGLSDIPRTRVYDAVRVLESKGLVEVQHSSPQVFRAVTVEEAVETLEAEYQDRFEQLRTELESLEPSRPDDVRETVHEVWTLKGEAAIANRANSRIEEAEKEVFMIIGDTRIFTDELSETLEAARERGVEVILGTVSDDLKAEIEPSHPGIDVFVSGLEWLRGSPLENDSTEIGRLLLVDRENILVSSFSAEENGGASHEMAVFGAGFDNGIVAIVRRILATGFTQQGLPKETFDK